MQKTLQSHKTADMATWLFVDGLNNDLTNQELADLFIPFGHILVAHVMYTRLGEPLGYGYVKMANAEEATQAAAAMDEQWLGDEIIHLIVISAPADAYL